jgi:hypothetical protein
MVGQGIQPRRGDDRVEAAGILGRAWRADMGDVPERGQIVTVTYKLTRGPGRYPALR